MTTPTLLTRETIGADTYTSHRTLFVTPRGGCGERITYRINRKTVARLVWEAQRSAALAKTTASIAQ